MLQTLLSSPAFPYLAGWLAISVASLLLHVLGQKYPRVAAFGAALGALGVDLPKLGAALLQVANGKASPGLAGVIVTGEKVVAALENDAGLAASVTVKQAARKAGVAAFVAGTGLVIAMGLLGCTPGQLVGAGGTVATLAPLVPLICQEIPGLAGSQLCADTTTDISAIAKLIGGILVQVGSADGRKLTSADLAPEHFRALAPGGRYVYVTLPAWQAALVRAKLGAS